MIKVYQIKKEEVENIYPESSFNYGMGDFDPIANIDKYHHVAGRASALPQLEGQDNEILHSTRTLRFRRVFRALLWCELVLVFYKKI